MLKSRFKKQLRAVAFGALLAIAVAIPMRVGAQPPAAHGWWWKGQPDTALPAKVPAPPTVPTGGLYVASDAGGPTAVSAMRFDLSGNIKADQLKLTFADTKGTPAIQICPTNAVWQSEQGGSFGAQPASDCKDGAAASFGQMSPDGKSINFAATNLVAGSFLNVVVLPLKDKASQVWPVFQASFSPPNNDSLSVFELPLTEPPPEESFEIPNAAQFSGPVGTVEPFTQPAVELPEAPAPIAAPGPIKRAVEKLPPVARGTVLIALFLLLVLAAFYYWTSFRPDQARQLLGGFGKGNFARSASSLLIHNQRPRGIGRFAKPRVGAPPRI